MFFSNRVVRRQVHPGHLTAGGVEFLGENLCKTNWFSYTSTSNWFHDVSLINSARCILWAHCNFAHCILFCSSPWPISNATIVVISHRKKENEFSFRSRVPFSVELGKWPSWVQCLRNSNNCGRISERDKLHPCLPFWTLGLTLTQNSNMEPSLTCGQIMTLFYYKK